MNRCTEMRLLRKILARRFLMIVGVSGTLALMIGSPISIRADEPYPSVAVSGTVAARATYAPLYRLGGWIDLLVTLRSYKEGVGVGCLNIFRDFLYRLVDSHGRHISTRDGLASIFWSPSIHGIHQCDSDEFGYRIPLDSIYPKLAAGSYTLQISVQTKGAALATLPEIPIVIEEAYGSRRIEFINVSNG